MKTTLVSFVLLFTFSLTNIQAQVDLTAQQIIEKNLEATGGKEYIQSIKTLYTDVATEMEGRQVNWIVKEMLPNKGSFQIVYQGRTVFHNFYDGEKGYQLSAGKKQLADQAEFGDKKFRKNIFNELDYLDPSLYSLELVGEEKVDKQECYKIKATCINGAVRTLYYDKKTFLQLREDTFTTEKGRFDTTYFYDHKKYGKLTYYTYSISKDGDKMQKAKIVALVVNDKVNESDFR